jgi:hypothetical protein
MSGVLVGALSVTAGGVAIALLIVAAVGKQASPASVEAVLRTVLEVPGRWTAPLRRTAVGAEMTAAILLAVPVTRFAGAFLVAALVCGFVATVGIAALRGKTMACGCFGSATPGLRLGAPTLALSGLLIASAAVAVLPDTPAAVAYPAQLTVATVLGVGYALSRRVRPRYV